MSKKELVKFKNKLRVWRILHQEIEDGCAVCYRNKEKLHHRYGVFDFDCGPWYNNKLRENGETGEIIEITEKNRMRYDSSGGWCVEFIRKI